MAKNKVTEEIFNTVKYMTKGGASIKQCCTATGLSNATMTYIRRAETFDEYKDIIYKTSDGYKKKMKELMKENKPEEPEKEAVTNEPKSVPQQSIVMVANQYMAEQLAKQTELLTLINNKLTLIAEDLGCFRDVKSGNA